MSQTPSVGRIVHYVSYGTPGGEYQSENRAAIVTAYYTNDYSVDLAVLSPTGLFFNESVPYDDSVLPDGGTWHWPARVDDTKESK